MVRDSRYGDLRESSQTRAILEVNNVIKNTYILLSMTLLFSAITAGIAMFTNAPPIQPWFVPLALYIGLSYLIMVLRNSVWGIVALFGLTGFIGFTLGPLLNSVIANFTNGYQLIMTSMGLTGIMFFGLSGYALTTRANFNYLGGFLFVGIATIMIAMIANIFLQLPILSLALSCGVVLLMSGYILYQTSELVHGGQRNYILATLDLYISVINLFVHLLNILSALAGRRE